ncbi:hypothetical protein K2Y11_15605 [bacterium]|nr:hypothetical protein [bacterium]
MSQCLVLLAVTLSAAITGRSESSAADVERPESARPYQIVIWLERRDVTSRDETERTQFERALERSMNRVLGNAWKTTFERHSIPFNSSMVPEVTRDNAPPLDKIFHIVVFPRDASGSRKVSLREFDRIVSNWTSIFESVLSPDGDSAEELLRSILTSFRPVAKILGRERGKVEMSLRGETLLPVSATYRFATPGMPFVIARTSTDAKKASEIVPWSYLIYRPPSSGTRSLTALSEVASVFRNPIAGGDDAEIKLYAVACAQEPAARTIVYFQNKGTDRPIVGYDVAVRALGRQSMISIGTTDAHGDISVTPVQFLTGENATPVIDVLLRSGQTVIARLPIVPGTPPECTVPIMLDPLLPEVAGKITSLQEDVLDVVAKRKVLERRLRKAEETKNTPLAQNIVDKLNGMPNRLTFAKELDAVRQSTDSRSKELKQTSLGLNVKRLFSQTEFLLNSLPKDPVALKSTKTKPVARPKSRRPATSTVPQR